MNRTLLASTAIACVLTGGAMAQDTQTEEGGPTGQDGQQLSVGDGDTLVFDAIGDDGTITLHFQFPQAGEQTEATQATGQPQAADASTIHAESVTITSGDGYLIIRTQGATAGQDADQQETAPAQEQEVPEQDDAAAVDDQEAAQQDQQQTDVSQLTADELLDAVVYSADQENLGEVNDVVLTQDGDVDAIIVDVGGFLGIGVRQVALGLDNVEIGREDDGSWYVYTAFTQEQLEAQPEYDEATYQEQRDQQRLQ